MDALAAAYAEVGKFENAIATEAKAIDLLKKMNGPIDIYFEIDQYIEHLKLHKANTPRREK